MNTRQIIIVVILLLLSNGFAHGQEPPITIPHAYIDEKSLDELDPASKRKLWLLVKPDVTNCQLARLGAWYAMQNPNAALVIFYDSLEHAGHHHNMAAYKVETKIVAREIWNGDEYVGSHEFKNPCEERK
jgi:hypothetical protein